MTWSLLAGDDTPRDTDVDKMKEKEKNLEKGDRMSTGNGTGSKKNADQDYVSSPRLDFLNIFTC